MDVAFQLQNELLNSNIYDKIWIISLTVKYYICYAYKSIS